MHQWGSIGINRDQRINRDQQGSAVMRISDKEEEGGWREGGVMEGGVREG